ncbi:MAG: glycosyltransferase family 4 protein [Patescibacteria group bacterium]
MNVLWFTWKDARHPWAGGAEVVGTELRQRLVADGHAVRVLTSAVAGAPEREVINGVEIIRRGGQFSVYWHAFRYYRRQLIGWADVVIDEVNTLPFFCRFFVREPNLLLVHQLCREIWFYQMSWPLKYFGFVLEPVYLWLLRRSRSVVVSESTSLDLQRCGFSADRISVISEGIRLEPLADLSQAEKSAPPILLSFGSVRPMKRTAQIVRAFELARQKIPTLRLVVAGDISGGYGAYVMRLIDKSPHRTAITCYGQVSEEQKIQLLRQAHLLAVTSVKEGWCLVVTEANSQGTPAVVYDVDGLRDSVWHDETGLVAKRNTPAELAQAIVDLLSNHDHYDRLRQAAYKWSQEINFDRSYQDLIAAIKHVR